MLRKMSIRGMAAACGASLIAVAFSVRLAGQQGSAPNSPFSSPDVVPITVDQLDRFEKALRYEIDQITGFEKFLASIKSAEEYQACSAPVMSSPEAMKMIQDFADKSADLPADQFMKGQQAMYASMAALVTKRCGINPSEWPDTKRADRLRQIEGEASDIAKPVGWTPRPPSGAGLHYAILPNHLAYAGDSAALALQVPNPLAGFTFMRAYAMLKERIPKFCFQWSSSDPAYRDFITTADGSARVVRVPGENAVLWYVYTEDEAKALRRRCDVTMTLLNSSRVRWNTVAQGRTFPY